MGQVYVPQVNWFLAISCILIVIGFQSSAALAAAYGIAVALTMLITGTMLPVVARLRWRWSAPVIAAFVLVFITIDLSYVAGNAFKILQGS